MSMSNHFEERLLQQLRQVVTERPAPTRAVAAPTPPRTHRRRFVLAGAGGVAAVAATVAVIASSGGVTESAYAVTPRADGSVTVKISSLSDADGLQRALRAAGVPAVVRYDAATTCPAPAAGDERGTVEQHTTTGDASGPSLDSAGVEPAAGAANGPKVSSSVRTGPDGTTFTIDPGPLASGDKVYITAPDGTARSLGLHIGKDAAGACAPAPSGR
ncbi:MAG TPA: hypothetical protein VK501_15235 [Baekduia sp.]|uniref:hypothetical protein n=1 Tax=Baekduia sp. TaxID=2600305 RepID=UPI002BDFF12B|nr:hypothetical protein [Baekduia sp.]HMJ35262.1 hypothetical protein [Baekduia sp.]